VNCPNCGRKMKKRIHGEVAVYLCACGHMFSMRKRNARTIEAMIRREAKESCRRLGVV